MTLRECLKEGEGEGYTWTTQGVLALAFSDKRDASMDRCKLARSILSAPTQSLLGNISSMDTLNSSVLDVKLVSPMFSFTSSPEGSTLYWCTDVRTFTGWPKESKDRGP